MVSPLSSPRTRAWPWAVPTVLVLAFPLDRPRAIKIDSNLHVIQGYGIDALIAIDMFRTMLWHLSTNWQQAFKGLMTASLDGFRSCMWHCQSRYHLDVHIAPGTIYLAAKQRLYIAVLSQETVRLYSDLCKSLSHTRLILPGRGFAVFEVAIEIPMTFYWDNISNRASIALQSQRKDTIVTIELPPVQCSVHDNVLPTSLNNLSNKKDEPRRMQGWPMNRNTEIYIDVEDLCWEAWTTKLH